MLIMNLTTPTITGWWLSPTPMKNMSSSVGIMTFPIYGKKNHVPNHQPDNIKQQVPDLHRSTGMFNIGWMGFP